MSKLKSRDFESRPVVPCAHEGCPDPAIMSRKLQHGWAFLCKDHNMQHVQADADEFCRANGLTSREAQLDFIRQKFPRLRAA